MTPPTDAPDAALPAVNRSFPARAAERAVHWFFAPTSGIGLELSRILLGLVLMSCYLRLLPYLPALFGPEGIGGHDALVRSPGWTGLAYEAFARFRVLHLFDSIAPVIALYGLLLASAACFLLGVFTRAAGVVAASLHVIFNAHNPQLSEGWSWLLAPFVFYVAIAAPAASLSLPALLARRRGDAPRDASVVPWGMRLLQIHTAVMYFAAGVERIDAPGWLHGEMVLRSLVDTRYARFDLDWFALRPALVAIAYFVLLIEPLASVLLWIPRAARILAPILLALHLGMEALIDVGYWQWLMCAGLVTFLPPEWLARLVPRFLRIGVLRLRT
ncbi:MAG: hypothetical protein EXR75_16875 [Myxococcales bacterium]|nr:hypothetical protein [Myxococcales bacterium]